jgi:hypothetical protein
MSRKHWLIPAILLLAQDYAYSQQVFGSINGSVTDKSGAAIPKASITIFEETKHVTFQNTTNSSGFYSQGQLIPGSYRVTVKADGFAPVQSEWLNIRVDQVTRFDAILSPGDVTSSVEVSAATAPLLEQIGGYCDAIDLETDSCSSGLPAQRTRS